MLATVLIAAALLLSACSAKAATKADAGSSVAPSAAASVPAPGGATPTVAPTTPKTSGTTGTPSPHGTATPPPSSQPIVKVIVHYAVAATHTCSWKVGSDGNLSISIGFKITASGKNPPTNVPFEMTDGLVTMKAYEPVGTPFQAVLNSGKPLSANAWVGKIVTANVTVNTGQANAAHASITLNGPVKGVASGDTYCPAD